MPLALAFSTDAPHPQAARTMPLSRFDCRGIDICHPRYGFERSPGRRFGIGFAYERRLAMQHGGSEHAEGAFISRPDCTLSRVWRQLAGFSSETKKRPEHQCLSSCLRDNCFAVSPPLS